MDWWGREELERYVDEEYEQWHMFMRDYMRRNDRYAWRERPTYVYLMERLEHAHRRGKLSKEEYKLQIEGLRDRVMHPGGCSSEEETVILNEFSQYRQRRKEAFNDKPNPAQSEEKFYELEKARIKWHQELEEGEWHTVYVIKNMVANNIILGNDYHIYRIIDMTKNLQEPVFLTKMAYMAVRMNTASCLRYLLEFGEFEDCGCHLQIYSWYIESPAHSCPSFNTSFAL